MFVKSIATLLVFFLAFLLVLSIASSQVPVVGTWRGYVYMSGSLAPDGTYVTAHIDNSSTAAATTIVGGSEYAPDAPTGYYSLDVQCTGNTVNFKVCGIDVSIPSQNCTSGPHYNGTEPNFNLSVTKLADGASCSYSCACSGGYCCSGATEYTDGSGTGTCQSSVCTAATTTTTQPGGVATTTTTAVTTTTVTTTTTTLPVIEETQIVETIAAGTTEDFNFVEPTLSVSKILVTTKNTVTNVQITVKQTSTRPATVAVSAPDKVYSYLIVTKVNITDADIESVKIRFKVKKSWINENNIDRATVALRRYADGAWAKLPTVEVSSDATYVYFEATSSALSVFAITAKPLPPTTTTTTTLPPVAPAPVPNWMWYVVGVAIVFLILLIVYTKRGKTVPPPSLIF